MITRIVALIQDKRRAARRHAELYSQGIDKQGTALDDPQFFFAVKQQYYMTTAHEHLGDSGHASFQTMLAGNHMQAWKRKTRLLKLPWSCSKQNDFGGTAPMLTGSSAC